MQVIQAAPVRTVLQKKDLSGRIMECRFFVTSGNQGFRCCQEDGYNPVYCRFPSLSRYREFYHFDMEGKFFIQTGIFDQNDYIGRIS